jgi:hypothetical protein
MMPIEFPQDEDALPPAEVRFIDVHVEPWPDGRRVRVHVQLTPFQQRPNVQVLITDPAGEEVCSANIIETMDNRFVFTLHLRGEPAESYNLEMQLLYDELGIVDQRRLTFSPPATSE